MRAESSLGPASIIGGTFPVEFSNRRLCQWIGLDMEVWTFTTTENRNILTDQIVTSKNRNVYLLIYLPSRRKKVCLHMTS